MEQAAYQTLLKQNPASKAGSRRVSSDVQGDTANKVGTIWQNAERCHHGMGRLQSGRL